MPSKTTAQEIIEVLDDCYKENFKGKEKSYPYSEWEKKRNKVKQKLKKLPEYVTLACKAINREDAGTGRPKKLSLEQKVMLFLYARLMRKSNRGMEETLLLLSPFGADISYKTIERLYSDPLVKLALHNLFILLLEEDKPSGDYAGDGTGYALSVQDRYSANRPKKGKKFVYFFSLIDIETCMYVAYGTSFVSEMDAFNKALDFADNIGINIDSLRLDKYYSSRKVIRRFGSKVSLFLMPKKNLSRIGLEWFRIFQRIMYDPLAYLSEYFMRNKSESGFSADKGRFGSVIRQKRDDRMEAALLSVAVLHNLHAVGKG
jgi:transposase